MYLLDTNVISELRPGKRGQSPAVLAWAATMPLEMQFISCITLLELRLGMELKARQDSKQGALLEAWIQGVEDLFADRTLPITAKGARLCAPMHVPNPADLADTLIAATALEHGFTMVSRNVQDFSQLGVSLINPWDFSPAAK